MVDELLEKIGSLTLVQAAELVKKMEEKFGISAAAPVAVAAVAAPAAAAAAEAVEEKTEFTVVFESFSGDKKVDAIKKVREITNLPLMDAKKLVEEGNGVLKEGVSKEEAEKIKKELEAIGAKIVLK
ncbi:MAG: 50S ribosomal protein L7/L12 [Leptospiraceae bacterium]|nr:50S ribosomal protein L7/L12 [Leptospiraceae bacterium]MDW8305577.1 50S ribosomal protein L7/L12 [Leptospiraceae bacterium]